MVENPKQIRYETLISREVIAERVKRIAEQIDQDYADEDSLVFVGVLKGASFFMADLVREVTNANVEVDFVSVSSYGSGRESSREPIINLDIRGTIRGKNVILVEDIVDTGYSINTLLNMIKAREPKSLKVCALLSKTPAREVEVPVDYLGFEIDDKWVEGYGLDTDQMGRTRKDIVVRISS